MPFAGRRRLLAHQRVRESTVKPLPRHLGVATAATARAHALICAAAPAGFVLLWSTGPVATKIGVADLAALDLLAWRFALLAAIMGGFALATGRLRSLPWHVVTHCAVAGVLIQAIYLGSAFAALDMGMTAGLSALITGLQPLVAAALAAAFLDQRLGRRRALGMALAGAGLLIYAGHQLTAASLDAAPLALHLAGVISIGAGLVYQRRFCSGVALLDNVTVQYVAGALFVAVSTLALPAGISDWTPRAFRALLWLILVLSLGATTLLVFLTNRGHVVDTANLFFLAPPLTAVIARVVLGEPVTGTTLSGLALTTLGVAVATRRVRSGA